MRFRLANLSFLFAVMSIAVLAQENSESRVFNPDHFSSLSRLRNAEIQELLKIDQQQKDTLIKIQRNWEDTFGVFCKMPADQQDRTNLREILAKYERAANDALDDEQRENLSRLTTLTYFGLPTLKKLRREEYRNELTINEEQTELIDALYRRWLKKGLD